MILKSMNFGLGNFLNIFFSFFFSGVLLVENCELYWPNIIWQKFRKIEDKGVVIVNLSDQSKCMRVEQLFLKAFQNNSNIVYVYIYT